MAGDWMKVEVALPDKPEVWAMSQTLDIDPDAVVFGRSKAGQRESGRARRTDDVRPTDHFADLSGGSGDW